MKTLCAILLVGVVAYVQANHECDPYAVNVDEAGTSRTGHDANNAHLALKDFLKVKKGAFYTTQATPSDLAIANRACTAPTHGNECAGVEYYRELKDGFETFNPTTLLKGVQFDTVFIGYNSKDGTAIEYKMTMAGHNEDDYIFRWAEGTPITAHKLEGNDPNRKTEVNIPDGILKVLKSEFALYSYKFGQYYLYVTCDGKIAWVSYSKTVPSPPQVDNDLQSAIEKLVAFAKEKDNVDLTINPIDLTFPSNLSEYIKAKAA